MISGQSAGLWLLADCNNFYASCERLFRPDLRNRPVVVLSNNDGCVIARSAEAKALNIAMGEAEFRIHGFLKEHGVAVFSSNFALYGDLSARVIQTLETLCQDVRQYSIDEAFCRLTGAEAARLHRHLLHQNPGQAGQPRGQEKRTGTVAGPARGRGMLPASEGESRGGSLGRGQARGRPAQRGRHPHGL